MTVTNPSGTPHESLRWHHAPSPHPRKPRSGRKPGTAEWGRWPTEKHRSARAACGVGRAGARSRQDPRVSLAGDRRREGRPSPEPAVAHPAPRPPGRRPVPRLQPPPPQSRGDLLRPRRVPLRPGGGRLRARRIGLRRSVPGRVLSERRARVRALGGDAARRVCEPLRGCTRICGFDSRARRRLGRSGRVVAALGGGRSVQFAAGGAPHGGVERVRGPGRGTPLRRDPRDAAAPGPGSRSRPGAARGSGADPRPARGPALGTRARRPGAC